MRLYLGAARALKQKRIINLRSAEPAVSHDIEGAQVILALRRHSGEVRQYIVADDAEGFHRQYARLHRHTRERRERLRDGMGADESLVISNAPRAASRDGFEVRMASIRVGH
jgi:hypothetical protein